jgi:hypothetical protein
VATTKKKTTKPAGRRASSSGAFKIDPKIPELFVTHLEAVCAVEGSAAEKAARRRRDRILSSMDDQQLRLASVLAGGIARLCNRGTDLLT